MKSRFNTNQSRGVHRFTPWLGFVAQGALFVFGLSSQANAQSLLHSENDLEIMEYSVISNPGSEADAVTAEGEIRVHQFSDISSDTISNAGTHLEQYSAIYNDVTAGGLVTQDPNSYIQGTITENTTSTLNAPIPAIGVTPGTTDAIVPMFGTQTLSPGDYDYIHVGADATLIVPAGTYAIDSILLDDSAKIVPEGVVHFDVKSSVIVDDYASMAPDPNTGVDGRVILTIDQATTTTVAFETYTEFVGEIYAPAAPVTFNTAPTLTGAVLADTLTIGRNAVITLKRFTPPPIVSITGVAQNATVTSAVNYTVSVSDADNNIVQNNGNDATVTLDGSPVGMSGTVTGDGTYLLVATADDADGNTGGQSLQFTIDATGPVVTVGGAVDGTTYRQPFLFLSFSASDALSNPTTTTALLDGSPISSGALVNTAGPHTLEVTAVDAAGNTTVETTSFYMLFDASSAAFLASTVVYGEDSLLIENNTSVVGNGADLYGETDVSMTTDGVITADIVGGGTASVGANTVLNGDISIGGLATIDAAATVNGTVTENQAGLPMPVIPIDDRTASGAAVSVAASATQTLGPGTHGNLAIGDYGVLHLSGGTYVFGTMTLGAGAQLLADDEVDVFVSGAATMGFGAEIESGAVGVNATDMRFVFGSANGALTVGDNTQVVGTFFLPGGTFDLGDYANFTGSVWAKDVVLRQQSTTTFQIRDGLPPVVEILGVTDGAHYNSTPVAPLISAYDDDLSSIDVLLDGVTAPIDVEVTADGTYALEVTATDAAAGTTTETLSFTVDTTAPVLSLTGVDDAGCYPGPHDLLYSATDLHLQGVTGEIDASVVTSPHTISTDGEYVFTALATDIAGNTAAAATTFKVDGTAPSVSILGVTEGGSYTNEVEVDVEILDANLTTFVVQLDGATVDPALGAFTVSSPGSHTVHAEGTDCAGNTTIADVTFSVVSAAPEITIAGVDADAVLDVVSVSPTFSATGNNIQSVTATLNTAPFTSGTAVTAEGDYILEVTATDVNSNTTVVTRAFAIDRTAPAITIVEPVDDLCTDQSVTLAFGSTDAHPASTIGFLNGVETAVNDVVSADGSYVLFVSAVDEAYNVNNESAGFIIDTIAPTVTVTGVSDGEVYGAAVEIGAEASDANDTTTTLTIDGSTFAGGTYAVEGAHTLVATATDCAGNETTSTINFQIDTQPPAIAVTGVVDAEYSQVPVTVGYSATDASSVMLDAQLSVNGGAPGALTSGTTISAEASYVLIVTATDAVGNEAVETVNFAIDATPPVLSLVAPQDGSLVGATSVNIRVNATDANLLDVRIGASELFPVGNDVYAADFPVVEGPQQFSIIARDFAGNDVTVPLNVTSDNTYPVVTVTAPEEGARLSSGAVTVVGTVTDANSPAVTINGASVPLVNGSFSQSVTLIPGDNTIRVVGVDEGGNETPLNRTVRMNQVLPTISITTPTEGEALDSPVLVTGTVTNGDAQDNPGLNTVFVNGTEAMVSTAGDFTANVVMGAGLQTFTATVTDLYGLSASASRTVDITGGNTDAGVPDPDAGQPDAGPQDVDAGTPDESDAGTRDSEEPPPSIALSNPSDGYSTRAAIVVVDGSIENGTSPFTVTVNGLDAGVNGADFSLGVPVEEGTQTLTIIATDADGRRATSTRSVIVDRTSPYLAVSSPASNPATVNISPYLVVGTVADSNLASVTVNGVDVGVFGGQFQSAVPLSVGDTNVEIVARDTAGNRARIVQVFSLDTPVPQVSFLTPVDGAEVTATSVNVEVGVVSGESIATVAVNGVAAVDAGNGRWTAVVPVGAGNTTLTAIATDGLGNQGSASISIESAAEENQDLVVSKVTPPSDSVGAEYNTLITLSFNKPVDRESLRAALTVREAGEVVPGGVYVAPGGTVASFSTARPFKAKSRITVELEAVDAETGPGLSSFQSAFTTRAATTILRGVVTDKLTNPRANIAVTAVSEALPDRQWSDVTNIDGNWAMLGMPQGRAVVTFEGGRTPSGERLQTRQVRVFVSAEADNNTGRMPILPLDEGTTTYLESGSPFDLSLAGAGETDYAGLTIKGPAGSLYFQDGSSAGFVAAKKLPIFSIPFAFEREFGNVNMWQVGPGLMQPSAGLELTFPNLENAPAGRHAFLLALDPVDSLIRAVGIGKVDATGEFIEQLEDTPYASVDIVGYVPLTEAQDAEVVRVLSASLGSAPQTVDEKGTGLGGSPRDSLGATQIQFATLIGTINELLLPVAHAEITANQITNSLIAALFTDTGPANINGRVVIARTTPTLGVPDVLVENTTTRILSTTTNEVGGFTFLLPRLRAPTTAINVAEIELPPRPVFNREAFDADGTRRIERVPSSYFASSAIQEIAPNQVINNWNVVLQAVVFKGPIYFQTTDGQPIARAGASEDIYDPISGELTHLSDASIETTEVHILRKTPEGVTVPYAKYSAVAATPEENDDHGYYQRTRFRAFNNAPTANGDALARDNEEQEELLRPGDELTIFAINHRTGYAGIAEVRLPSAEEAYSLNESPGSDLQGVQESILLGEETDGGVPPPVLRRGVILEAPLVLFPPEIEIRIERTVETLGSKQGQIKLSPLIRSGATATAQDERIRISSHWRVRKEAAPSESNGYDGGPLDPFWDLPEQECPPGSDAGCVHQMSDDDYLVNADAGPEPQSIGKYLLQPCGDLPDPETLTDKEEERCRGVEDQLTDVPQGVPPLAGQLVSVLGSATSTITTFPINGGLDSPVVHPAIAGSSFKTGNYYVHVVGYPVSEFDADGDGVLSEQETQVADFSDDPAAQKPGLPKKALGVKSVYRRRPRGQSHRQGEDLPEYYDPVREVAFSVIDVTSFNVGAVNGENSRDLSIVDEGEDPSAEIGDSEYQALIGIIESEEDLRSDENIGEYQVRLGGDASGIDCEISEAGSGAIQADCGGPFLPSIISALDVVYMELFQEGNVENILARYNFLGLSERIDYVTANSAFTAEKATAGYQFEASASREYRAPVSDPSKAIFFVDGEEIPQGGTILLCTTESCNSPADVLRTYTAHYNESVRTVELSQSGGLLPEEVLVADIELRGYRKAVYFSQVMPPDVARMLHQENEGARVWVVTEPVNAAQNSLPDRIERAVGLPRGKYDGLNARAPGQSTTLSVNLADGHQSIQHSDWAVPEKGSAHHFTRTFNNSLHEVNSLGVGWMHNFQGYLREEIPGRYQVVLDGQSYDFPVCEIGIRCTGDDSHGASLEITAEVDSEDPTRYSSFSADFRTESGDTYRFSRLSRRNRFYGGRKFLLSSINDRQSSEIVISYRQDVDGNESDEVSAATRGSNAVTFAYDDTLAPTDVHPIIAASVSAFNMPRLESVTSTFGAGYSVDFEHDVGSGASMALEHSIPQGETNNLESTYAYKPTEEFHLTNELISARQNLGEETIALTSFQRGNTTPQSPYLNSDPDQVVTEATSFGGQRSEVSYLSATERRLETNLDTTTVELDGFGAPRRLNSSCGETKFSSPAGPDGGAVVLTELELPTGKKSTQAYDGSLRVTESVIASVPSGGLASPGLAPGYGVTNCSYDTADSVMPGTCTVPSLSGSGTTQASISSSLSEITSVTVGGQTTARTISADRQTLSAVDESGMTTTILGFDERFGLPTSIRRNCGSACAETITLPEGIDGPQGVLTSITATIEYDDFGRVAEVEVDEFGYSEKFEYDGAGRVIRRETLGGPDEVWTFEYSTAEDEDEVTATRLGDDAYVTTKRFQAGLLVRETENERVSDFDYETGGCGLKSVSSGDELVTYEYADGFFLERRETRRGNDVLIVELFDKNGFVRRKEWPDEGRVEDYERTPQGLVTRRFFGTDARFVHSMSYDEKGHITALNGGVGQNGAANYSYQTNSAGWSIQENDLSTGEVTNVNYDILGRPTVEEVIGNASPTLSGNLPLRRYKVFDYLNLAVTAPVSSVTGVRSTATKTYYQLGSTSSEYRAEIEVRFDDAWGRPVEISSPDGTSGPPTRSFLYDSSPPNDAVLVTEITPDGDLIDYVTLATGDQTITADGEEVHITRFGSGRIAKEETADGVASVTYEYDGEFASRSHGTTPDGVYFDHEIVFSDDGKTVSSRNYSSPYGVTLNVQAVTQQWNGREVTRELGEGLPTEIELLDSFGNRVRLFTVEGGNRVSDRIVLWEYDSGGLLIDVLHSGQWTIGPVYDYPGTPSHGNPIYIESKTGGGPALIREQRIYYGYHDDGVDEYAFDSRTLAGATGTVFAGNERLTRIDEECDSNLQPSENFVSSMARFRKCFDGEPKAWYEPTAPFTSEDRCKELFPNASLSVPEENKNCHERRMADSLRLHIRNAKFTFVSHTVENVLSFGSLAAWKAVASGSARVVASATRGALRRLPGRFKRGPCRCFTKETLVHTSEGYVPIEEVSPGDLVWAKNETTGIESLRVVNSTIITPNNQVFELILKDALGSTETIGVTLDHPFWVKDVGWTDSQELRVGDSVYSASGEWLTVAAAAADLQRQATTYNIEVEGDHTYFVGESGAWVHNTCLNVRRFGFNKKAGGNDYLRRILDHQGLRPNAALVKRPGSIFSREGFLYDLGSSALSNRQFALVAHLSVVERGVLLAGGRGAGVFGALRGIGKMAVRTITKPQLIYRLRGTGLTPAAGRFVRGAAFVAGAAAVGSAAYWYLK